MQLATAPLPVQKAFIKQLNFLSRNLKHPSLHAKKYDEVNDVWQARINDDWRFYFSHREQQVRSLIRRAAQLGLKIVETKAPAA